MPPSLRPDNLLAAILSSIDEALVSFSLDGLLQSWSHGAEQLYGYSAAETVGQPITMLLPIYEIPGFEAFLTAARTEAFDFSENGERLRKGGSRIRVALKRSAIRDAEGAVVGVVELASARDWHAEGSAADRQLRNLVDQMPAILWTTDQHLRITSNWG